jgi:hypothetical protein
VRIVVSRGSLLSSELGHEVGLGGSVGGLLELDLLERGLVGCRVEVGLRTLLGLFLHHGDGEIKLLGRLAMERLVVGVETVVMGQFGQLTLAIMRFLLAQSRGVLIGEAFEDGVVGSGN